MCPLSLLQEANGSSKPFRGRIDILHVGIHRFLICVKADHLRLAHEEIIVITFSGRSVTQFSRRWCHFRTRRSCVGRSTIQMHITIQTRIVNHQKVTWQHFLEKKGHCRVRQGPIEHTLHVGLYADIRRPDENLRCRIYFKATRRPPEEIGQHESKQATHHLQPDQHIQLRPGGRVGRVGKRTQQQQKARQA